MIRTAPRNAWLPRFLLVSLILAIALGPRIRIPGLLDRAVDIRIQDLVLFPLLAYLGSRAPSLRPVWARWQILFTLTAVILTALRLLLAPDVGLIRTIAYLGRALEPLLLAVVVAGLFRLSGETAGRLALRACLVAVGANALWAAFQTATGTSRTLLGGGVGDLFVSYGPKLVGEGSAFGTGIFFAFATAIGCAQWLHGSMPRGWAAAVTVIGLGGVYLAQSRVSFAATALCLLGVLLLPSDGRRRNVGGSLTLAAGAAAVWAIGPQLPSAGRLSESGLDNSLDVRVEHIYIPIIRVLESNVTLLIGIGPGQLGTPHYPWVEAHNVVLRALLDYGLVGTILYFGMIVTIVLRCFRAGTDLTLPRQSRMWATLAGTFLAGVTVAGMLQETLSAVTSTHLTMLAVGLFAGSLAQASEAASTTVPAASPARPAAPAASPAPVSAPDTAPLALVTASGDGLPRTSEPATTSTPALPPVGHPRTSTRLPLPPSLPPLPTSRR